MSASACSLIDPTNSSILLTDVLKNQKDFYEAVKLNILQDEKQEIGYVKHSIWLVFNEYLIQQGIKGFPRDLELCNKTMEATTEILGYKPKHIPKIVETIWAEAQNYIVMTNFPTTSKDMEMMRLQETLMQNIIKLDERARLAQPGEIRITLNFF